MAKASVVDMVLAMVEKIGVENTRTVMDECEWFAENPIEAWKVEEYVHLFENAAEAMDELGFEDEEDFMDEFYCIDCGKDGFVVLE